MSTATLYAVITSVRPDHRLAASLAHPTLGILATTVSHRDWLVGDLTHNRADTKQLLAAAFPGGYRVRVIEHGAAMPPAVERLFWPEREAS